jgi:hypothetical protein
MTALISGWVTFRGGIGHMDGDSFHYMVLSAETLGNLRFQKRHERKRPERLGDEDISHFTELCKVLPQIFG